jgi:Tfp pilus assembly protein PilZ
MDSAEINLIEKIRSLALQLPEQEKHQLLTLTSTWKKKTYRAQREKYTELVCFTSEHGTHHGYAKDINVTGLFIESKGTFKIGDPVQLSLAFISALNPISLGGEVVRKTDDGIGIQFDNRSQGQLKHLDSIISKHSLILRQGK